MDPSGGKSPGQRRFNWYLWERFARRPSVNGYSREISDLDELSLPARQAFLGQLEPGERPQQVIFAPYQTVLGSQPGVKARGIRFLPWEYTRDRIVALTESRLLAVDLDDDGQKVEVTSAPLDALLSLQSGKILLFSWLEWAWAQDGQARRLRCYFNTVCEHMYFNLAEAARCALLPGEPASVPDGRGREPLNGLPFKFRNMLPKYLLEGERVEQVLFRPSHWERQARLWRVHTRAKAALLLTDLHLLVAEEELTRSEDNYGLIVTYLPRSRVRTARVREDGGVVNLSVQTGVGTAGEMLDLAFPLEMRAELENLAGRMGS